MVVRQLVGSALSFLGHRLAHLLPRDDDVWAFGCRGGERFEGNAKYLYLHVAAEDDPRVGESREDGVRPVWFSWNRDVVRELRAQGFEAHHAGSLRGRLTLLRAGTVFVTGSMTDLPLWTTGGAKVIQLWHGIPLKRISVDAPGFADRSLFDRLAARYTYRQFDAITVTSAELGSYFRTAFRTDADVPVTGYPRNDALFSEIPGERICQDDQIHDAVAELDAKWVVAYLPTYREATDDPASRIDFEELERFLAARDAAMLVKFHPFDAPGLDDERFDRVHVLPPGVDVYPVLRHVDALVTDYSSIYFDYLLLDRPVAFYAYDRDEYGDEEGLYLDYDAVTPGPVATNFDALLDALESIRTDPDAFADERDRVRELVFDHTDGRSAMRVRQYAGRQRARTDDTAERVRTDRSVQSGR